MVATGTRKIVIGILVGVLVFSILKFTSKAFAADWYIFERGDNNNFTKAQEIKDPQTQQYVYGIVTRGEDTVDYYALSFAEFTPQMHIDLLVPSKEVNRDFHPSLVFVDPHVNHMQGKVPFGFPLNVGGRVYEWNKKEEKKFSDETMQENLLLGPSIVRDMANNRYIIAVYDPDGKGGRYVLRLGAAEPKLSIQDRLYSVFAFLRIKFQLY